jgi:hypothetical protein
VRRRRLTDVMRDIRLLVVIELRVSQLLSCLYMYQSAAEVMEQIGLPLLRLMARRLINKTTGIIYSRALVEQVVNASEQDKAHLLKDKFSHGKRCF